MCYIMSVADNANYRREGNTRLVNVPKLKGKMVEMSVSAENLAGRMGINVATLYRRFNDSDSFTVKEVRQIAEILKLTADEVDAIFFGLKSRI